MPSKIPAITLCPPGACPPESITPTFSGVSKIQSSLTAENYNNGLSKLFGNNSFIFFASDEEEVFLISFTFTIAPFLSADGSVGL